MSDVFPGEAWLARDRAWAKANPNTVGDIQTLLRGLSYLLVGYVKESFLLSEFVFSAAQLINLLNTRIIEGDLKFSESGLRRLEDFYRVISCVEVFAELLALRLGGPAVRWALIFSLQVLKSCINLVLLFKSRRMIRPLEEVTDVDINCATDAQ